jgi:hypothetical protein
MLDGATGVNLMALFAELIGEGFINFELQTSALCMPDESGMVVLTGLQHRVRKSGGTLAWDGLTVNHPFVALPADASLPVIAGQGALTGLCTPVITGAAIASSKKDSPT